MRRAIFVLAVLAIAVAAAATAIAAGPPSATTGSATGVGQTTATLNGTVDPQGSDTTYHFEYGTSSSYGLQTGESPAGAGTGGVAVSANLSGLTTDTTYHYRVVATNSAGTSAGQDLSFTTAQDVTAPVVQLVVRRQRFGAVRKRGVVYQVRCNERCSGGVQLFLRPAAARRLRLPLMIGRARLSVAPSSAWKQLRVPLRPLVRQRLAARPGRLVVTLDLSVADAAHNGTRVLRALTLVR
jgi:hypothetical protein